MLIQSNTSVFVLVYLFSFEVKYVLRMLLAIVSNIGMHISCFT
jgi:hypothetical protein